MCLHKNWSLIFHTTNHCSTFLNCVFNNLLLHLPVPTHSSPFHLPFYLIYPTWTLHKFIESANRHQSQSVDSIFRVVWRWGVPEHFCLSAFFSSSFMGSPSVPMPLRRHWLCACPWKLRNLKLPTRIVGSTPLCYSCYNSWKIHRFARWCVDIVQLVCMPRMMQVSGGYLFIYSIIMRARYTWERWTIPPCISWYYRVEVEDVWIEGSALEWYTYKAFCTNESKSVEKDLLAGLTCKRFTFCHSINMILWKPIEFSYTSQALSRFRPGQTE